MTDRELLQHKMALKEQMVWKAFCRIISRKCALMDTPPMNQGLLENYLMARVPYYGVRGYSKEDGYYDVQEGDRGELHVAMRTHSLDEAVAEKLIQIAHDMSYAYVVKNQKEIDAAHQAKWRYCRERGPVKDGVCEMKVIENSGWEYDAEYDYRKYWFELALVFLGRALDDGRFHEQIIRYEGLMNYHFQERFWVYDLQKQEFVIAKG